MARILLTSMLSDIAGHVAGTTFQKTGAGLCAQTKVVNLKKRSYIQSKVRQAFKESTAQWDLLTQSQRDSWINAASGKMTGFSLYQSVNNLRNRKLKSQIKSYIPPSFTPDWTLTDTNITYIQIFGRRQVNFDFTVNSGPSNPPVYFTCQVAAPLSTGRKPTKSIATSIFDTNKSISSPKFTISVADSYDFSSLGSAGKWYTGTQIKVWLQFYDNVSGLPLNGTYTSVLTVPPIT